MSSKPEFQGKMSPRQAKQAYGGKWHGSVLEAWAQVKDSKGRVIPNRYESIFAETYMPKQPVTPEDSRALQRAADKRHRRAQRNKRENQD